jgi:hypothetical protein
MGHLVVRVLKGEKTRELARRLIDRVPDFSCRVCGHNDFALIEDADDNVRTSLDRKAPSGDFGAHVASQRLLTLLCTNCGHLEQFAQAVLDGATPVQYGQAVE